MAYARFAAMIATSTALMFGVMYLNSYALDHLWFSQTRAWMALAMGALMAVVMLVFMRPPHGSAAADSVVAAGALAAFAASIWLVRTQDSVFDVDYMKAMIPHHSIAILTSERAHIRDPRVRALADRIIADQRDEITQMEQLIGELEKDGVPSNASELPPEPPQEKDRR